MNLAELAFSSASEAVGANPPEALDAHELVAQLGSEVARSLSSALERVATLAATGQIDRDDLRTLREEIELARHAGIMGQQLVRLSRGDFHLSRERVDLSAMLQEALHLRQRELKSRNISTRQTITDVTVVSDAALLFSLIETLLDWCSEHARSRVVLRLDVVSDPTRARLSCGFLRKPVDEGRASPTLSEEDPTLSTLSWRLLSQTALVLGLRLRRRDTLDRSELKLSFDDVQAPGVTAVEGVDTDDVTAQSYNVQPLAGRHVVVLAARREVRNIIRDTLQPMGLMVDFVSTLVEAQELFTDALPHAVVYEASLGGERFQRLRGEMLAEVPSLAFIQIAEHGKAFEVLEADGHPYASVGREAIAESLPAALLFELSRHG